jgi:hypothetical protein
MVMKNEVSLSLKNFLTGIYQVAEKLNSASHGEERKRRGNLKMFDFIMNGIASLRSQ